MYYLDCEVNLQISFADIQKKAYHIVGRLTVDYFNNNTQIELLSWDNKNAFLSKETSVVTFLTLNDAPKFDVDPSLFALRCLTQVETSPFYNKEIKCWYELQHLTQLYDNEVDNASISVDK